ncbi:MAG: DUF5320 family protein [Candidatus Bathyarchaeia archaeon]
MPRGDGTGPNNAGPMTGRAAGYCAGYPVPGYMNPTMGYGRGGGRGHGRGMGRGFGRGRFVYPQPVVVQPVYQTVTQPQTAEQEIVSLESYQKTLEAEKLDIDQEMGGVKARMEELKAKLEK